MRAAEHSHSAGKKAREIRREAVSGVSAPKNVGRFTPALAIGGVELELPAHGQCRNRRHSRERCRHRGYMVSEPKRPKPSPGGFDPSAWIPLRAVESSGILSRNGPEGPFSTF
ncbi:hypothetical protein [Methylosinus sp. PW1]|uniref:hypothetical protein n=1 Tax=Methylosinus sp. PW1 TaxID=107636 RepID=UPI0035258CA5